MCAGKVRAGFTPASRRELYARLAALPSTTCPFANLPNSSGKKSHWGEGITVEDMKLLTWVKPRLVAEVSFTECTRDDQLRHAAFVALRDDKKPTEVRREA